MLKRKRIETVSVVDQVCEAIKEMIQEVPLKPGDKLPSEQELADSFGVNKLSVRMALQKLNTLGVIEKRNGEGSFVKNFSISPLLIDAAGFYDTEAHMNDIQEMRSLLEGDSAVKAASTASEEEKEELKRRLKAYNETLFDMLSERTDETTRAQIEADMAFHMQIVHMSHNQMYVEIYRMIQKLIENHILRLVAAREADLKKVQRESDIHNALCEAICDGRGEDARKIVHRIVDIREEVLP